MSQGEDPSRALAQPKANSLLSLWGQFGEADEAAKGRNACIYSVPEFGVNITPPSQLGQNVWPKSRLSLARMVGGTSSMCLISSPPRIKCNVRLHVEPWIFIHLQILQEVMTSNMTGPCTGCIRSVVKMRAPDIALEESSLLFGA